MKKYTVTLQGGDESDVPELGVATQDDYINMPDVIVFRTVQEAEEFCKKNTDYSSDLAFLHTPRSALETFEKKKVDE